MKYFVDFDGEESPISFVACMLANTSPEGELCLLNWFDVTCEDCSTFLDFSVQLHWNKHDLQHLIADYRQLENHLFTIGEASEEPNFPESAFAYLSDEEVLETYHTYVAPFDAETPEEMLKEVTERVGKNLCGYEMIAHANRLCRLVSMSAPKAITDCEGKYLIAAMAINRFATKKTLLVFDPIPQEIRNLRSLWAGLLHHTSQGTSFELTEFREIYEKTLRLLSPHITKEVVPKHLLPLLMFAYNFGQCPSPVEDITLKAAQRLAMEMVGYFSFGNIPFEEGTTLNDRCESIPLPFHDFENALKICQSLV